MNQRIPFLSIIIISFGALLFHSCIPQRNTIYLQDKTGEKGYTDTYKKAEQITERYKIQSNDYLYIKVLTTDENLIPFYNLTEGNQNMSNRMNDGGNMRFFSYLVDGKGEIDFPNVGKIKVLGLTRSEVKETLQLLLSSQLEQFTLMVQLANINFTVLGEANAGLYQMPKDQLTIYEALAISGDLKTYSKRKKVQVIRKDLDGISHVNYIDLTDKNLLDSEESYILPNDIIYVEPLKAKTFGFGETFSLGLLSSLVSFYLLISRF